MARLFFLVVVRHQRFFESEMHPDLRVRSVENTIDRGLPFASPLGLLKLTHHIEEFLMPLIKSRDVHRVGLSPCLLTRSIPPPKFAQGTQVIGCPL